MHEETGLRCALEQELAPTHYTDPAGRPKRVRWWRMQALGDDGFTPNDEIDELRWLDAGAACAQLTYDRDRALLGRD